MELIHCGSHLQGNTVSSFRRFVANSSNSIFRALFLIYCCLCSLPALAIPTVDVSVSDASASEPGTDDGAFLLQFSEPLLQTTTFFYSLSGSAERNTEFNGDYSANATSVVALTGATSVLVPIDVLDDSEVEVDETVVLTLIDSGLSDYIVGSANQATLTIVDDDVLSTISFTNANYQVNENGSGQITITVQRMGGGGIGLDDAIVGYAVTPGSASAPADFTAKTGTLTWFAGDTNSQQSFTVDITDDTELEGNETINLQLLSPVNANLGAANAQITIIDNESAGTLQFSATNYSVAENGASAAVSVSRTGGASGPVTVTYTTSNGSATAGSDYVSTTGTLRWADGDSANKTFAVPISDDNAQEGNETITLTLSNPSSPATLGNPSTATLTITDVEEGTLQFSTTNYRVNETDGTARVTVQRIGGSVGEVSVQYQSAGGTATADQDYRSVSDTLVWSDGDITNKDILVTIIPDSATENDETLQITLANPTGNAKLGTPTAATLTISEQPLPTVDTLFQFTQNTIEVNENATVATINVERTGNGIGVATVGFVTLSLDSETAQVGLDYAATNGFISWQDGETGVKQITIPLIDDPLYEGTESTSIGLVNATNGSLGAIELVELFIKDDEVEQGPLSSLSGDSGATVSQTFTVSNVLPGITISAERGSVEPAFIAGTSGEVTYTFNIPADANVGDVITDTITITDFNVNPTTVTAKITVGDAPTQAPDNNNPPKTLADAFNQVCVAPTHTQLAARCGEFAQLNSTQQQQALDAIAPDEVAAQGANAIELNTLQIRNLRSRLMAVRAGVRGFAFNGFSIGVNEDQIPVGALLDNRASGGAAGEEDEILGLNDRFGAFINGRLNVGDKETTDRETGYDLDKKGITLGADYRINNQWFLGAALGISDASVAFAGAGGNLDAATVNVAFYGSYYKDQAFHSDWILSLGRNRYDTTRNLAFGAFQGQVKGDTNGNQLALSINTALDRQVRGFILSPYLRMDYVSLDIDRYREQGTTGLELAIHDQSVDSLTLALGGQVSRPTSQSWGVVTPSVDLALAREFKDDVRTITSSFVSDPSGVFNISTDEPDRVYYNLGLSLAAQFSSGRAGFIRYDTVLGLDDIADHTLEAGYRMEF